MSDGEKCTIALFGDLARRMALANPNKDNPLDGEGIVLIDEIELHLHPLWQRRI
ncbi:AAA family ATPase [Eubacterium sp. MSJ-13]|uniref:AAA family ATPase n=1 Tax=Eubacterium sp. MSJ-13 TaxID=2841513 RepID=UPI001C10DE4B|nr:AAA family ATPase [Eubacterium sp. MSJ-13]